VALRVYDRDRKRQARSVVHKVRTAIEDLEQNDKDYIVVKKVLGTMVESTYKRWLNLRDTIPYEEDFIVVQPPHGRSYYDVSEESVYRKGLYPKLDKLVSAMKELYPAEEGWELTLTYLEPAPGTLAERLHSDSAKRVGYVVFGGLESESTLVVFNKSTKKLEKVTYNRGDVVIIKKDTIRADWYNNSTSNRYGVIIDIVKTPNDPQKEDQSVSYFSVKSLKEVFGAPNNLADLGPTEMLGPLLT
jgi:hypothetical protein